MICNRPNFFKMEDDFRFDLLIERLFLELEEKCGKSVEGQGSARIVQVLQDANHEKEGQQNLDKILWAVKLLDDCEIPWWWH